MYIHMYIYVYMYTYKYLHMYIYNICTIHFGTIWIETYSLPQILALALALNNALVDLARGDVVIRP